jgi:hypothetical protein
MKTDCEEKLLNSREVAEALSALGYKIKGSTLAQYRFYGGGPQQKATAAIHSAVQGNVGVARLAQHVAWRAQSLYRAEGKMVEQPQE